MKNEKEKFYRNINTTIWYCLGIITGFMAGYVTSVMLILVGC